MFMADSRRERKDLAMKEAKERHQVSIKINVMGYKVDSRLRDIGSSIQAEVYRRDSRSL